jgi:hypothetical protein
MLKWGSKEHKQQRSIGAPSKGATDRFFRCLDLAICVNS